MELPNQELMESWDKILELDNQIAKLRKDSLGRQDIRRQILFVVYRKLRASIFGLAYSEGRANYPQPSSYR